jgi:Stf0 sulfotransferase
MTDQRHVIERTGAGQNEVLRNDALCSEQWDRPDELGLRARYAVFSAQRTGSEWLCDYLRQCAIGVPFEYFNHGFMLQIADRLGCASPGNFVFVSRYISALEPLRARNGIFGTKLQPDQLRTISDRSDDRAVAALQHFDRLVLLGRRDKFLQAISLARAHLTNQWQLYGGDDPLGVTVGDDVLFPMIGERLARVVEDDRYMSELVSRLDPKTVRLVWYEDLTEPGALESVADWLWDALGGGAPRPEPDRSLALARKMDEAEAHAIKQRYLAFIEAGGDVRTDRPP